LDNLVTTNIWVSLQSKEQFISKATEMIQKEATISLSRGTESISSLAKISAQQVVAVVVIIFIIN
jgi:vacuolar-type H+-ATPase subunit H